MATTASVIPAPGAVAPNFWLADTNSNNHYSYEQVRGAAGTVVMFLCNNCPFVLHTMPEVIKIVNDYRVQGIGFIAINSNDAEQSPQDSPQGMTEFAFNNRMDFPYLYDEMQDVARDYGASYAPDFYLFDKEDKLVYHGQLDDSRPGNGIALSGTDLRTAIDGILYNRSIPQEQKPSMGSTIKWKRTE